MNWTAARATTAIAAVTAAVSLALIVTGMVPDAAVAGGFIPLRFEGAALPPDFGFAVPTILTPLTATLIHGGFAHIAFNLVMLVYCGAQTERALGPRGIAILYVVGAYAAALAQYFPDPASPMPMIGASGAISAIVGAYALLFGRRRATKGVAGLSAGIYPCPVAGGGLDRYPAADRLCRDGHGRDCRRRAYRRLHRGAGLCPPASPVALS